MMRLPPALTLRIIAVIVVVSAAAGAFAGFITALIAPAEVVTAATGVYTLPTALPLLACGVTAGLTSAFLSRRVERSAGAPSEPARAGA